MATVVCCLSLGQMWKAFTDWICGAVHQEVSPSTGEPSGSRLAGGPLTLAELQGLAITMADFEGAIPHVQPAVKREGFATLPDVTWADVGALEEVLLTHCLGKVVLTHCEFMVTQCLSLW